MVNVQLIPPDGTVNCFTTADAVAITPDKRVYVLEVLNEAYDGYQLKLSIANRNIGGFTLPQGTVIKLAFR